MNARLAVLADAIHPDHPAEFDLTLAKHEAQLREAAAILRALAEQEPVAWLHLGKPSPTKQWESDQPLYTHPKEAQSQKGEGA